MIKDKRFANLHGSEDDALSMRQSILGIGLISMATLMFELVVNKALSFSTWGSLGYMIIGSAIFGFSIAGVAIAIWQPHKKYRLNCLVSYAALLFSVSVALCYVVMNLVPFNFEAIPIAPLTQVVFFSFWYLSLLVPFTMTGFIVALLLMSFKNASNRLYSADLVGAAAGCIIVVPLFPLLGAAGQYTLCAALGALAAICFSYRTLPTVRIVGVILLIAFIFISPFAQNIYTVKTHQDKRQRSEHYRAGYLKHSMWSFLSKVEVAIVPDKNSGMLWFDGGLMQSRLDGFDGDYERAQQDSRMHNATSIPYRMKKRENVLILAPAGGRELRSALVWDAKKVTGVELDFSVVDLVTDELNNYLGGIFNDHRVTIINDEGRSFIRRSTEKYDTIQFISAYSTTAIQSGAINLASSFLLTGEAFDDYLDHLTADGVLAIARDLNLRLFFSAWEALERRGLEPEKRLVLLAGGSLGRNTVLVKLREFQKDELEIISQIVVKKSMFINYAPPSLLSQVDEIPGLSSERITRDVIEEFVNTPLSNRGKFYKKIPYKVIPVDDDSPFFNDLRFFLKDMASSPEFFTEELKEYTNKTWYMKYLPIGHVGRLVVLCEAAVFALLFLVFPLWKLKSQGVCMRWQKIAMIYFLSLGLGFIWIEITLLKQFVLFLGSPVYSIAVILFAMLLFAGIGSLLSERIQMKLSTSLVLMSLALFGVTILATTVYPTLLPLFFGFTLFWRMVIAVVLIAPIGVMLGMPFPIGLKFLAETDSSSIPWAWAMNGYATVIGVSTAVYLAMTIGFSMLLWSALFIYLLGFVCLGVSQRSLLDQTASA